MSNYATPYDPITSLVNLYMGLVKKAMLNARPAVVAAALIIVPQTDAKSTLEGRLKPILQNIVLTPTLAPYQGLEERLSQSTLSGSETEVDDLGYSASGQKILGLYNTGDNSIKIVKGLPPYLKNFVLEHERAHRRRHFAGESQDERLVDEEAARVVGYNPFRYSSDSSGNGIRLYQPHISRQYS